MGTGLPVTCKATAYRCVHGGEAFGVIARPKYSVQAHKCDTSWPSALRGSRAARVGRGLKTNLLQERLRAKVLQQPGRNEPTQVERQNGREQATSKIEARLNGNSRSDRRCLSATQRAPFARRRQSP
eukprot:6179881-Pleurochrysis_carterae.AAC.2